jgi:hypothetical protein
MLPSTYTRRPLARPGAPADVLAHLQAFVGNSLVSHIQTKGLCSPPWVFNSILGDSRQLEQICLSFFALRTPSVLLHCCCEICNESPSHLIELDGTPFQHVHIASIIMIIIIIIIISIACKAHNQRFLRCPSWGCTQASHTVTAPSTSSLATHVQLSEFACSSTPLMSLTKMLQVMLVKVAAPCCFGKDVPQGGSD